MAFPTARVGYVTHDEEARIRDLLALLGNEDDPQKVTLLAAELGRLFAIEGKTCPPSDNQ
jgi:hypothetical protein